MTFCKLCGGLIFGKEELDGDCKMWSHMKAKHPEELHKQRHKYIGDLFKDNFVKEG